MKFILVSIFVLLLFYSRQISAQTPVPDPCITSSPTPTLTPTPNLLNNTNIIISEVMVDPDTGQSEWVELYNQQNISAHLENWAIDDVAGAGASPKTLNADIPPLGYIVVELASAIFNNDGDFVRLIDATGVVKDSLEYTSSQKGKSIGRSPGNPELFCIQEASKGQPNNSCINQDTPTPTKTITPTYTLTPTPTRSILSANTKSPTPQQALLAKNKSLSFKPISDVQAAENSPEDPKTPDDTIPRFFLPIPSWVFSILSVVSLILRIKVNTA